MPPPGAPMAVGIVPQDRPCRPPELYVEGVADDNVRQAESTWKATTQVEAGALPDPSCSDYPVRPRIPLEEVHIESFPDGGVLIPKESMPKFSDSEHTVKRRRQSVEFFESEIIRVKKELCAAQEEGKRLSQVALTAEAKAAELVKAAETKAVEPYTGPDLLEGTLNLLEACKDADNAKAEASLALKRESEARKEADKARLEANESRKEADKAQCFARLARIESELVAADVNVRMDELSMTQRALQVERLRETTAFAAQVSLHRVSTASGAAVIASIAKQAFEGAFEVESKAQELEMNSKVLQEESRLLREKIRAQEEEALKTQTERAAAMSRAEALRKIQEENEKKLKDSSQRLSSEASELRSKLETLENEASQARIKQKEEAKKGLAAREEQESRIRDAEAEALRARDAWEKQVLVAQDAEKRVEKFRLNAEELNRKLAADNDRNLEIQTDLERKASKARQLREEEANRADTLESMARKLRLDAEELREKLIQQEKETQVQQARAEGLMKERMLLLSEAEDLRLQASRMAFRSEEQPIVMESRGVDITAPTKSRRGRASKAAEMSTVNPSQRDIEAHGVSSSPRVRHKAATNIVLDTTESLAMRDEIQENVGNLAASDSPKLDPVPVGMKKKGLLHPAAQRRSTTKRTTMTDTANNCKLNEGTMPKEVERLTLDQCAAVQSRQEADNGDAASINTQLPKKRKSGNTTTKPETAYSSKRNNKQPAHSVQINEESDLSPVNMARADESSSANIEQKQPNAKKKKKTRSDGENMMNVDTKKASKEMDNKVFTQSTTPRSERDNIVHSTRQRPSRMAAIKVATYWEGEPPSPQAMPRSSYNQHAAHNADSKNKSKENVKKTSDNSNESDDFNSAAPKPSSAVEECDGSNVSHPQKRKPKDHNVKKRSTTSLSNKITARDSRSNNCRVTDGGNGEVSSDSISAVEKNVLDDDSRWDVDTRDSHDPVVEASTTDNRPMPLKRTQESSGHVRKLSTASSTLLGHQQPPLQTLVRGETKEVSLKTSFQGAYRNLSTTKFGAIRSGGGSLLGSFRPPKLAKRKY